MHVYIHTVSAATILYKSITINIHAISCITILRYISTCFVLETCKAPVPDADSAQEHFP